MALLSPLLLPSRKTRGAERRPRRIAPSVAVACLVGLVSAATVTHADTTARAALALRAPVAPFSAVRLFDRPDSPWGPGHRGIDLAASTGDAIVAPGDGRVTFAGMVVDRGVVTVDHGGTLRSSVEPILPSVEVGDRVRVGDALGIVSDAAGHCAPATCVHWGVRLDGEYINPLDVLFGYGRIVLLP